MTNTDYPLTREEFETIYTKVPRLTVEVILQNGEGAIYLTKRAIEPCLGQWHIPGGTVYFGENLIDAAKRVAERELGVDAEVINQPGLIEYPNHKDYSFDAPVGVVSVVTKFSGEPTVNHEASEGAWFITAPENLLADQADFLIKNGYLQLS